MKDRHCGSPKDNGERTSSSKGLGVFFYWGKRGKASGASQEIVSIISFAIDRREGEMLEKDKNKCSKYF